MEAGLLRQGEPAAGEALELDRDLEQLPQHLLQARGVLRLAEVAGVEQLGVALPRVPGGDRSGPIPARLPT
jgi:hypothetical protein